MGYERAGIIGAGAMGSIFAYFLSRGGRTPALYEKDPAVLEALRAGLDVVVGEERYAIRVDASSSPEILRGCDPVFMFVKSYHTADASRELAGRLMKDSTIVTLQNGIGNADTIAEFIPRTRIVYGSTTIGATKLDERTVSYGGGVEITIGGRDGGRVNRLRDLLEGLGLSVAVHPNPDEAVWRKAIINAGINPLGALLGVPNGRLVRDVHAASLMESLVSEAVSVSHALGIELDPAEMISAAKNVCEKTAANLCSMLQDLKAGRRTEIESINGVIVRYGREHGVPTPVNDAVCRLVRSRESLAFL
jgi:2-dehydropantoate 2-reductase